MYSERNESLQSLGWVGAVIGIGTAGYKWYDNKMKKRRAKEAQVKINEGLAAAKTAMVKARAKEEMISVTKRELTKAENEKRLALLEKQSKEEALLFSKKLKETYIPVGIAVLAGSAFLMIVVKKIKGKKNVSRK